MRGEQTEKQRQWKPSAASIHRTRCSTTSTAAFCSTCCGNFWLAEQRIREQKSVPSYPYPNFTNSGKKEIGVRVGRYGFLRYGRSRVLNLAAALTRATTAKAPSTAADGHARRPCTRISRGSKYVWSEIGLMIA